MCGVKQQIEVTTMAMKKYDCKKGDTIKNYTIISDIFYELIASNGRLLNMRFIEVQCKCGEIYKKRVDEFLRRTVNTKFNWCGKCRKYLKGNVHPDWDGIGELPKRLYNRFKKNAETRDIEWNVSIEYLWELFIKQNKKCAISNIPLHFNTNKINTGWISSLDRIDNRKGYAEDNVRWIFTPLNIMKNNYNDDLFFELCAVVNYHNKTEWSYDKFLSQHDGRFLYGKHLRRY
jgi:hypothetical protein